MGRARASRGAGHGSSGAGSNALVGRRPTLTWSEDGLSFSIAQDAARLSERNMSDWIATAEEELSARDAARGSGQPRAFCACADFSHNDLSDGGVERLAKMLSRHGAPVRVLRLSKSRAADAGAAALAELLKALPEPMEELHLSHNRLTAAGACAILTAVASAWASSSSSSAADAPPREGASANPTWLRLENNCIDWEVATKDLESKQVRWGASDTRAAYRGGQRKDGKPSAQVLVHRSYRHQQLANKDEAADKGKSQSQGTADTAKGEGKGADGGGKAGRRTAAAQGSDTAAPEEGQVAKGRGRGREVQGKGAKGSDRQYERDHLLYIRHLLVASAAGKSKKAGLRCIRVPSDHEQEAVPRAETVLDIAPPPMSAPEPSRDRTPEPRPRSSPGKACSSAGTNKAHTISLEECLMGSISSSPPPSPPRDEGAPGLGNFLWNSKAVEFVPGSSPMPAPPGGATAELEQSPRTLGAGPEFMSLASSVAPSPASEVKFLSLAGSLAASPELDTSEVTLGLLPPMQTVPPMPFFNPTAAEFLPNPAASEFMPTGASSGVNDGFEPAVVDFTPAAAVGFNVAAAEFTPIAGATADFPPNAPEVSADLGALAAPGLNTAAAEFMPSGLTQGLSSSADDEFSPEAVAEAVLADSDVCEQAPPLDMVTPEDHLAAAAAAEVVAAQAAAMEYAAVQAAAAQAAAMQAAAVQAATAHAMYETLVAAGVTVEDFAQFMVQNYQQQQQQQQLGQQQQPPFPGQQPLAHDLPALNPLAAEFCPAGPAPGLSCLAPGLEVAGRAERKDTETSGASANAKSRLGHGSESTSAGEEDAEVEDSSGTVRQELPQDIQQDAGCTQS